MNALSTILPVFFMIALGLTSRVKGWITPQQASGLNTVVNKILFPIMIFNALFTTSLQMDMLAVIVFMFVAHIIAIVIGKLTSRFTSKQYKEVSPFLMATVDGGNICYPLYATIVGSEYIGNVVLLDIACMFVVFLVIPIMVSSKNSNNTNFKTLLKNLIKDPLVLTMLLGIVLQILGLHQLLENTGLIVIYDSIVSMATAPMVACILFGIGYRFTIERSALLPLVKTILTRVAVMCCFVGLFFVLFPSLVQVETFKIVVILYFLSPPALVLVSQLEPLCKKKEDAGFVSAFISLYMFITLFVYVILVLNF